MTAEVVALHGAPITDNRKARFLEYVAGSFDTYFEKTGHAPDALVMVFGGVKQPARASWLVSGDSEGGAASMLAFAQACIQREVTFDLD